MKSTLWEKTVGSSKESKLEVGTVILVQEDNVFLLKWQFCGRITNMNIDGDGVGWVDNVTMSKIIFPGRPTVISFSVRKP